MVLILPVVHVLPMNFQMGPVPMVIVSGIGSLLLVVHAQDVPELVHDVAHIPAAIAPPEVDACILIVARITDVGREAVILFVSVVHYQECRRWGLVCCLLEMDASHALPSFHCF